MKQKIIFLCPLFLLLFAAGKYMSKEEAKDFASRYYSNIEKTLNTGKIPTSTDEFIMMFGCAANGNPIHEAQKFPNPMFLVDNSGGWCKQAIPETIFGDIAVFKHNHNDVTFHKTCVDYDYCKHPEMIKNEDNHTYAWIHFRTEWTINGGKRVIDDTVYVELRYNYISRICNKLSPLESSPEETLEDMSFKAAGLYTRASQLDKWYRFGRRREAIPFYNEAFELYKKIEEKDPNNAYYHLGVMYFKGQGNGKNMSKKQRRQKAYECWKKSDLKKARRAISYITDGRE